MSINYPIPETRVLAIASHLKVVYGHVGNSMAVYVMQALGCEVSSMNTVHFSNHTGYRQFTGPRTPASTLTALHQGLTQSHLTDFDMLLTGYAPSADAVTAIGTIASDLRSARSTPDAPGRFFWVLDPVMGDTGVGLYVDRAIVPVYRELVGQADLLVPNQFEVELLSGVEVRDLSGVREAVERLHRGPGGGCAHVVVTSIRFEADIDREDVLTVVGSTRRKDGSARLFKVDVPALPCYFSGTGDMFAAMMVVRLREACLKAGMVDVESWQSPDEVQATDLPLAKATEKVLSSMQMVLEKTMKDKNREMKEWEDKGMRNGTEVAQGSEERAKMRHLAQSKAAEIRLVRNTIDLLEPQQRFKAAKLDA